MKRVTINDVSKHAGVSDTTVSHVINETRFVSSETKQRVLQAIAELNYTPSQVARSLATQQTYSVGLLISDVGNPFYHRVILGVEDVALANGYNVYLFNASYDLNRSLRYIRSMAERRVDGVLLMSSRMSEELLAEVQANQLRTVILDWQECSARDVGAISFDFETGIRQAVTHLLELGHRRFAHVSGNLELYTARVRRDLFIKVLAEHGIDPNSVPVIEGNFRIDGGRRAFRELESDPRKPTAVFTVNDMTALGLVFEAQNAGLRVPEQLSIIGVDDIELASELIPSLTTISLHCYETGALVMNLLLDLNEVEEVDAVEANRCHRVVETTLVIRQSTAQAPD